MYLVNRSILGKHTGMLPMGRIVQNVGNLIIKMPTSVLRQHHISSADYSRMNYNKLSALINTKWWTR